MAAEPGRADRDDYAANGVNGKNERKAFALPQRKYGAKRVSPTRSSQMRMGMMM